MTESRTQLALNVVDLDAPGNANFALADPPLRLVLSENPEATSPLNHLGVEVRSTEDVLAAGDRFAERGLSPSVARDDRCCGTSAEEA